MIRRPFSCAALALCISSPVFSQSVPDDDAVVVSASRTEQRLRDAIPHITILTAKDIRDSQAVDLPSLLRREAGFEFSQNGGPGTTTSLFMRGGRGNQTLVLIDGVRIQDASFGSTAIQHIMLDEVERVEVVRGNVSSLYGSGAIGGVVQVFTKRGRGAPSAGGEVTIGERGTSRFTGSYGGEVGGTRFNFTASKFDTRGFSVLDQRLAPNANTDADGYRNESFAGSLSHKFSATQETGISFLNARGRVEYDSAFDARTDRHDSTQTLQSMQAYWEGRFFERWTSRVTLAEGSDYRTDKRNSNFNSSSNTRNRQFGWENRLRIAPGHEAGLGVENLRQTLSNSGLTPQNRRRDADSLRLSYLGNIGRHSLQANLRGEDYSDFGRANTHFVGYGFDLADDWRLTASGSTAFRAPTFQDLYGFGGDPALRPERTRTSELGFQWASVPHRLRVVAFDTQYIDAITFSANRSRNLRRANVNGVESSYSGQIAGFDLRASLTVQDPVEQEPAGAEQHAIRRAKAYGSFSLARSFGPWRFGGELISAGARPDTHVTTSQRLSLERYTVMNLTARYEFNRNLFVAAKLENAFDEEYFLAHAFNTPRRAAFITLGWRP